MSLKAKLDALRTEFMAQVPPEIRDATVRAHMDLAASVIAQRTLKAGDRAPDFGLPDACGGCVRLKDRRHRSSHPVQTLVLGRSDPRRRQSRGCFAGVERGPGPRADLRRGAGGESFRDALARVRKHDATSSDLVAIRARRASPLRSVLFGACGEREQDFSPGHGAL